VIISRSEMNLLYANQKTICSNCTSFICHPQFLIYTTMEHRVCFLPWSYDFLSNGPLPINDSCALSSRRIERGATIVTHTPGDVGLVFQLPRGNLETVQPRALTISHVRHLLDQAEYGEAFRVCRRNRIDMNLLFDYNPQQFLRSCAAIVQQLHSVDNLNLLISGMRDENVTQTMYSWFPSTSTKSNMAQLTPPPPTSPSTIAAAAATPAVTAKVNSICTALRQAIDQNERASKLFHSALMTFVRMEPPDLEGALRRIQQRQQGSENDGSGEQALRYIVIFVNVDHLFRVALGMYDLPLSVSVAQHSTNKDPREYLPLLSGWRRLGEQGAPNYQRYQIDRYLGRNELALTNLLQAIQHKESLPAVDLEREFMQFCRQHSLHRHAISICPTGFPLQKVCLLSIISQRS
jgi:elongator complex protein 1